MAETGLSDIEEDDYSYTDQYAALMEIKRASKPQKPVFAVPLKVVLKQIHPNVSFSTEALAVVNDICVHVLDCIIGGIKGAMRRPPTLPLDPSLNLPARFHRSFSWVTKTAEPGSVVPDIAPPRRSQRIATESKGKKRFREEVKERSGLSRDDIRTAVSRLLPGELAVHALKNIDNFATEKLVFSGLRIASVWAQRKDGKLFADEKGPLALAAVVEYLAAEILELAGNCCLDNRRVRMLPRHVFLAVASDEELAKMLESIGGIIAYGGRSPYMTYEALHDALPNDEDSADGIPLRSIALRQIRSAQKCFDPCLPRHLFWEVANSILKEMSGNAKNMILSLEALEASHQAAEVVLIERFEAGLQTSSKRRLVPIDRTSVKEVPAIILESRDLAPLPR